MSLQTPQQKPLKVLVVDPSATERQMLKSILEGYGCAVVLAGNLSDSFALAKAEHPDVIIADCGPWGAGAELCGRVRSEPALAHVTFVILSSFPKNGACRDARVNLFAAGCDQVIDKPFKPGELWAAIDRASKRDEQDRQVSVVYRTGEFAVVSADALNQLLASGSIVCFRRADGIAIVNRDQLRQGTGSMNYHGPERRHVT